MNLWSQICEWRSGTPDYMSGDASCVTYEEIDCTDYVQRSIYCSDIDTTPPSYTGFFDSDNNGICDYFETSTDTYSSFDSFNSGSSWDD